MGGKASKISKTEVQLVDLKLYVKDSDVDKDEKYGKDVRIYRQLSTPQKVAIVTKVIDEEITFENTLEELKQVSKLKHPGLVQQLNIIYKKKSSLCSHFYKINCLYDYVDNDIEKDIQKRISCKESLKAVPLKQLLASGFDFDDEYRVIFDESEIWHILATASAVLSYLNQLGVHYGDLRPQNLCLTAEGSVKLISVNSLIKTNWSSFIEKLEGLETKNTYISPIQLNALNHKVQKPQQDTGKSDIFCLGVTILECCLLESAQDIYDFNNFSIDVTKRMTNLIKMNKYSKILINVLTNMLSIDESKRTTPEELYEYIIQQAFQNQIAVAGKIFSSELALKLVEQFKKDTNEKQQKEVEISAPLKKQLEKSQSPILLTNYLSTENEMPNQEEGEVIYEFFDNQPNNINLLEKSKFEQQKENEERMKLVNKKESLQRQTSSQQINPPIQKSPTFKFQQPPPPIPAPNIENNYHFVSRSEAEKLKYMQFQAIRAAVAASFNPPSLNNQQQFPQQNQIFGGMISPPQSTIPNLLQAGLINTQLLQILIAQLQQQKQNQKQKNEAVVAAFLKQQQEQELQQNQNKLLLNRQGSFGQVSNQQSNRMQQNSDVQSSNTARFNQNSSIQQNNILIDNQDSIFLTGVFGGTGVGYKSN